MACDLGHDARLGGSLALPERRILNGRFEICDWMPLPSRRRRAKESS